MTRPPRTHAARKRSRPIAIAVTRLASTVVSTVNRAPSKIDGSDPAQAERPPLAPDESRQRAHDLDHGQAASLRRGTKIDTGEVEADGNGAGEVLGQRALAVTSTRDGRSLNRGDGGQPNDGGPRRVGTGAQERLALGVTLERNEQVGRHALDLESLEARPRSPSTRPEVFTSTRRQPISSACFTSRAVASRSGADSARAR